MHGVSFCHGVTSKAALQTEVADPPLLKAKLLLNGFWADASHAAPRRHVNAGTERSKRAEKQPFRERRGSPQCILIQEHGRVIVCCSHFRVVATATQSRQVDKFSLIWPERTAQTVSGSNRGDKLDLACFLNKAFMVQIRSLELDGVLF